MRLSTCAMRWAVVVTCWQGMKPQRLLPACQSKYGIGLCKHEAPAQCQRTQTSDCNFLPGSQTLNRPRPHHHPDQLTTGAWPQRLWPGLAAALQPPPLCSPPTQPSPPDRGRERRWLRPVYECPACKHARQLHERITASLLRVTDFALPQRCARHQSMLARHRLRHALQ